MTTADVTAALPGAESPIADPNMSDHEVASTITDHVPGTHTDGAATPLGEHVYAAVITAILRERMRVQVILRDVAMTLTRQNAQAIGAAQLANAEGDAGAEHQAMAVAQTARGAFDMVRGLARVIDTQPGSCKRCLGSKQVPSRLAPGQLVACPDCAEKEAPAEGATT